MEQHDEIIALLERIEQNQQKALETQDKHLALAREQLERTNQRVAESIDLQRTALARQAQVRNVVLPVIFLLVLMLLYLVFFRM